MNNMIPVSDIGREKHINDFFVFLEAEIRPYFLKASFVTIEQEFLIYESYLKWAYFARSPTVIQNLMEMDNYFKDRVKNNPNIMVSLYILKIKLLRMLGANE